MWLFWFVSATAAQLVVSCPEVAGIQCVNVMFSYSLTGEYAGPSRDMFNGYKLWAQTVNNGYGITNPLTGVFKINLIAVNDDSDSSVCFANYDKYWVSFLLGPFGDELSAAAQSAASKHGSLLIQSTAVLAAAYNSTAFIYGVQPLAKYYASASIKQALRESTVQTVYTVTRTDLGIATEMASGADQYIAEAGFVVVGRATYTQQSLNSSAAQLMSDVKRARPDALFIFGTPSEVETFIGLLRTLAFTPKALLAPLAVGDPSFVERMGPSAYGVLGAPQWLPTLPPSQFKDPLFQDPAAYAALYQSTFGVPPTEIAAAASAAGYAMQLAFTTAAGMTRPHMARALDNLYMGLSFYGKLKFNRTEDNGGANIGKIALGAQVQNGNVVLVAPPTWSRHNLQYPMPSFPPPN